MKGAAGPKHQSILQAITADTKKESKFEIKYLDMEGSGCSKSESALRQFHW